MSSDAPLFVVVGNVNQGKSSIVAALSEDSRVPIAAHPGTTVKSGEYPFSSGDKVLFRLVDTPGFQDARKALAWLEDHSRSEFDHKDTVKSFLAAHEGDPAFEDEVRLLRPVIEGAGVLYVIDAASRFQPSHKAEMEIIQWTGQPRMALINRTRERDFTDEWMAVLDRYFNIVRPFDAHGASFDDRIALLRSFGALRSEWKPTMDEAVAIMERDWESRSKRSASIIAELLTKALSHVERHQLKDDEADATEAEKTDLEARYTAALIDMEAAARAEIEGVYRHQALSRESGELSLHDAGLFSETSWRAFGLKRGQLAKYGAAWGTAIGAAVDLMVGGLSFFVGAAIGGVTGGLAGWMGGTKVARTWGDRSKLAKALFPGEHGKFLGMGPATSPRFAWMLLDRGLIHWQLVQARSHARADAPLSELLPHADEAKGARGKQGIVATLESGLRNGVDQTFQVILKQALKGEVSGQTESRLRAQLREIVSKL